MAKRQRYPSDHRRWFRVMEDILDDPKITVLGAADRWCWVAVLALLNRGNPRTRNGTLQVTLHMLQPTFCKSTNSAVKRILDRLENAGLLEWEIEDGIAEIRVSRWPESQALQRDSEAEPGSSLVYFCSAVDRIKVGTSTNLESRLAALRTSIPDIELLGTVQGTRTLEKRLHRKFLEYHIKGEWFTDCNEIRTWISKNCGQLPGQLPTPSTTPTPTPTPNTLSSRESEPRSPLLNLLSKLPGGEDEKQAFIEHTLPLIEAEVEDGNGSVKTLTIRYYRQYAKKPEAEREYFDWDRKQARLARMHELAREPPRPAPASVPWNTPATRSMFD